MIIRMLVRRFIVTPLIILLCTSVFAQETQEIFDYLTEEEYVVGGVSVSGIRYLDINALIGISGLRVGQKIAIPGEIVSNAAKKLWQQGLFSDVRITINRIESDTAGYTRKDKSPDRITAYIIYHVYNINHHKGSFR
jgi:outer membrane protein insertion porin family